MVKKLKWNLVIMSLLYLGLGVFLVMKPRTALNVVCYALGGVVLACAAVQLIRYFVAERGVFQSQLTLISGIVCLALGGFLILRSDIVVRILPIGAFVEIAPGHDGMVHISKLENRRVEKVEDVLNLGDMTWVKFMGFDEKGRANFSRKDALKEMEGK